MKNNSFIIVFVFTPSLHQKTLPIKKKKETSNKDRNIEKIQQYNKYTKKHPNTKTKFPK